MPTTGEITEADNKRPMLHQNGTMRVATPLAYVASCISRVEEDFLLRFFEAYCFTTGSKCVDAGGAPIGRYVDHAEDVDPDSYVRLEVQAYNWIRRYCLGREWALIGELFVRMEAGRATTAMVDLGGQRTNSYDERVALGGAQVTIKDLGLRLKDAYRDFFRWYSYVKFCEEKGREATPGGAFSSMQREQNVSERIAQFKLARGLPQKVDTDI